MLLERLKTDADLKGASRVGLAVAPEQDRQLTLFPSEAFSWRRDVDVSLLQHGRGTEWATPSLTSRRVILAEAADRFLEPWSLAVQQPVRQTETAPWFDAASRTLASFMVLHHRMPERRRITKEAISLAYAILRELAMEAVPAPALVPTFAGGIQLEWHTKGADVEIEIGPGGSVAGDVEDLSAGTKWSFEGSPSAAMLERVRTRLAA